ncbi:glycoprotein integral membrane protein 1 [Rhynchocyon petersi]
MAPGVPRGARARPGRVSALGNVEVAPSGRVSGPPADGRAAAAPAGGNRPPRCRPPVPAHAWEPLAQAGGRFSPTGDAQCADRDHRLFSPVDDSVRVSVTTLADDGQVSREQVVLNITYEHGQVYVNDFPVNNGVTRISCQTFIVKNDNLENVEESGYFGIVSVRILVHEWPMTSGSSLQLIVIQEEVVEIDGKQTQQKDVTEIDILVKNQGILRHSKYTLPLEESMLYSISRDSDTLVTLPNLSRKENAGSLQTTSQYLIRNVETTIDEDPLPGKLPETPLRAEPPSSYKVMCQWMEKFRKDLCRVWSIVFPVLFMFLNVMVVGIIGAAVVITILKVLFPVCEYKGILQLEKINVLPVKAINVYPDGLEKTAESLDDKTCI